MCGPGNRFRRGEKGRLRWDDHTTGTGYDASRQALMKMGGGGLEPTTSERFYVSALGTGYDASRQAFMRMGGVGFEPTFSRRFKVLVI